MICLFLSSLSEASTFYLADIGVRGMARGGAFVAGASDISAQWYNPAALTRIKGGMVGFHAAGVHQLIDFDRSDYPGEGPLDDAGDNTDLITPPVSNGASPVFIPHLGGAYGWENLTVFFGFTTPYAADFSYPADGPQRYSLIDTIVIQTYLGPSVAYKALPWLSLGLSLNWNTLKIGQSRQLALYSSAFEERAADVEDPQYDVLFEVEATDMVAYSYGLSALIEPEDAPWAIGINYQPAVAFDAKGSMTADFSETYFHKDSPIIASESATDENISLDVEMPHIIKAGVLYRLSDKLELETAFVWEGWGAFEALTISDLSMKLDTAAGEQFIEGPIVLPTGYSNSYSIRFGGEWNNEQYALRSGLFYETAGVPTNNLSVSLVDRNKIGLGFGGSYTPSKNLSIDVGFLQSYLGTLQSENSQGKRIAAVIDLATQETVIDEDRVVADGTYKSTVLLGCVGVTYLFGQQ